MHLMMAALIVCFSTLSWAAVKITGINESTVSAVSSDSDIKWQIFGGFAGSCPSKDGKSVCNSCEDLTNLCSTSKYACNERSVYDALSVEISLVWDAVPSGSTVDFQFEGDDDFLSDELGSSLPAPVANQAFTLEIPWSLICSKGFDLASCENPTSIDVGGRKDLKVGLKTNSALEGKSVATVSVAFRGVVATTARYHSKDCEGAASIGISEGFCQFGVIPGDGKVFLKDVQRNSTGPGIAGINWQALRVFGLLTNGSNFCSVAPGNPNVVRGDFSVTDSSEVATSLATNKLSGLENIDAAISDETYLFSIATVDQAQNVEWFSNPSNLDVAVNSAQPGVVLGMLDRQCFIATAAFGDPDQSEVVILRKFRDQFLVKAPFGQTLVSWYYQISPPIADFIASSETLRWGVRFLLRPLVEIADWILKANDPQIDNPAQAPVQAEEWL